MTRAKARGLVVAAAWVLAPSSTTVALALMAAHAAAAALRRWNARD